MGANAVEFLLDRHIDGRAGTRPAIVHPGGEMTYVQLAKAVNQAGHYLRRFGVRPEQRVVLQLKDSPEFVCFFLAALKIGAVAVPVNTFSGVEDLAFYLRDTRSAVLITHEAYAGKVLAATRSTPLVEHVLYVDEMGWRNEPTLLETFPVCEDDSAFWLYTSGSSGTQKAAVHSHGGIVACSHTFGRDVLQIAADDRVYSAAKLFFAYGLGNSVIFPFSVGASCVLNPDRSDPGTVAAFIRQYHPSLFFAVPTLYNQLLALPQVDESLFASVRMCISAGECLPQAIFDAWRRRTEKPVYDGIGSTEAMHIFCANRPEANRPGTSGRPVSGYELKIVDEYGAPVPVNEVGRLLVRGKTLAKGYWNRCELTRAAFLGEWLATGDIYQQTADGYFRYIGRQDDVFKSSGLWVSPAEVEQVLLSHPYVKEAAVVAAKNEIRLTVAKAFVVRSDDAALLSEEFVKQEIYGHLQARLPKYKNPAAITFLTALPKTATGKVARAELRRAQNDAEHAVETAIHQDWQETLNSGYERSRQT